MTDKKPEDLEGAMAAHREDVLKRHDSYSIADVPNGEKWMTKLPTKSAFKRLRDKYTTKIIPLYANNPYRFLVEEESRLQDLSDTEIDSMDLATGEDGSHMAYNLLKALCSKRLPDILAQFPNRELASEAFDIASRIGAVTGSTTLTELNAEVFLRYHGNSDRLEEILDSQENLTNVKSCVSLLRKYLTDSA